MAQQVPCIRDFCSYFDGCGTCTALKRDNLTIGGAYGLAAGAYAAVPIVLGDLPRVTQNEVSGLYFRTTLAQLLPWVATTIVITLVLMRTRKISNVSGVLLIVFIVLVAIISLSWVIHDSENVVARLETQYRENITTNINNNRVLLEELLLESYLGSNSCVDCCPTNSSPNLCTGIDVSTSTVQLVADQVDSSTDNSVDRSADTVDQAATAPLSALPGTPILGTLVTPFN